MSIKLTGFPSFTPIIIGTGYEFRACHSDPAQREKNPIKILHAVQDDIIEEILEEWFSR